MIDPETKSLISGLKQELSALKSELDALRQRHESLRIVGTGFSGQGDAIQFDANIVNAASGGGGDAETKRVIIVDDGVANYYDISATFVGAV